MNRASVAALSAIVGVVIMLSLHGWGTFQVGSYQDDAQYLVLARSIGEGRGYGMVQAPSPGFDSKYPFVFPLVLTPVVWSWPVDLDLAPVVALVATVANLVLLVWGWPWFAGTTSRRWALVVAALWGVQPILVSHARMVMSEPVFTFFTLASLLSLERAARAERPRLWHGALLGASLTLAIFTRLAGVVLWAAVASRFLFPGSAARPRSRLASAALGVVVGTAAVLLLGSITAEVSLKSLRLAAYVNEMRTANAPSPEAAGDDAAVFEDKAGNRLLRMQRVITGYAFGVVGGMILDLGGGERARAFGARLGFPWLVELVRGVLFAFVLVGFWQAVRTRALTPAVLWFEAFYGGMLLMWPWALDRLLYTLHPFLLFQFLLGVRAFARCTGRVFAPARPLTGRVAVALLCVLLAGVAGGRSWRAGGGRRYTRDLTLGSRWLRDNSPPDAIVAAEYTPAIYLHSGRKTRSLPSAESVDDLARQLATGRIDYLLIAPELEWNEQLEYDENTRTLVPWLEQLRAGGQLEQVYESDPAELVRVYRVVR